MEVRSSMECLGDSRPFRFPKVKNATLSGQISSRKGRQDPVSDVLVCMSGSLGFIMHMLGCQ